MAVTLNANTSSGFVQTADTSGEIVLQNNGTTRLTVNASGVTIPTLTATTVTGTNFIGTITQGTAVSASGTSVDFTGIPSWAKRVTVIFSGVSTNGTSLIQIQLGSSGGIENTGYLCCAIGYGVGSASANITSGFGIGEVNAAANVFSGAAEIVKLTGNTYVATGMFRRNATTGATTQGDKTLSDVFDRVRITTVNGTDTFDAGTINIQYEG
jgi:hypothetical protein